MARLFKSGLLFLRVRKELNCVEFLYGALPYVRLLALLVNFIPEMVCQGQTL